MTPKEKAQELFDKFFKYAGDVYLSKNDNTYHIANACIDYIISCNSEKEHLLFWREVKKELEDI